MNHTRHGVALLEVLIAMTILATTGLTLIQVVRQAVAAQVEVEAAEREIEAADRVLSALSLLKRNELDRATGEHPLGEFVVTIQRPERTLYRIAITSQAAPERQLLATVIHRPGSGGSPP